MAVDVMVPSPHRRSAKCPRHPAAPAAYPSTGRDHPPMRSRRVIAIGAAILAVAASVVAGPAPAHAIQVTGLTATIALNNCSGSLVRYPSSVDSDRAMLLTNGHCYEGGFINDGVVLQNRTSTRTGTLLSNTGTSLGTVRADKLIYGTMTNTDVALYQLTQTFAQIKTSYNTTALTIGA